jgi:hypothetical protein
VAAWVDLNATFDIGNEDSDNLVTHQVLAGGQARGNSVGVTSSRVLDQGRGSPLILALVKKALLSDLEPDGTIQQMTCQ